MDDEPFLAAIRASPADDTTRLVYADWLEERGDPRGEFLRAAVAARNAATGADLPRLLQRLCELRWAVSPDWVRRAYASMAEDDVRDVVIRDLVGGEAVGTFLQVEGRHDPSAYLFALVAGSCAGVQPVSAAELRQGNYYDKLSGHHGRLVRIDGLLWTAESRCDVHGACFVALLAAHGHLYTVGVKDGWWEIVAVSLLWIS